MGAVVGSSIERLRWGRTAGRMEVRDWPSLDVELEASLVVFEREEDSTTALPFAGDFCSLPMVGRVMGAQWHDGAGRPKGVRAGAGRDTHFVWKDIRR